jgi:Transposase DDE domain group 1
LFKMSKEEEVVQAHPMGEDQIAENQPAEAGNSLDTFAGKVHVKWAPGAAVSNLGLMPYFIEYLKTSGLFDKWVEDCPLRYTSQNAPKKRDVLGTLVLSVLAGHWRYAHISAIRGDGINPGLLGMSGVASEDSVRRGLKAMDERASGEWLKGHLKAGYEPLLQEPWVLDVDTTVKPLYGHQQDAKVGYNPTKPGRPSHAYHSYFVANIRMVLDMEVQAGNQTAPLYAQPELWAFLDGLPEGSRPVFLRGDSHWGAEKAMLGAEERGLGYLFKLKQSVNVKKLIGQIFRKEDWVEAGQSWQGREDVLRLSGWTRERRVVVLRRPLRSQPAAEADTVGQKTSKRKAAKQLSLDLPELTYQGTQYEYAVLVTSLPDQVRSIAQLYRDRSDAENNFDELKNQWGWAGFATQDRKRCQIIGRIIALVYNWWTIFMRLGIPDKHAEAITSRPLALHGIARQTRHGNQTTVEITSTHAKASQIEEILTKVSGFLKRIKATAGQLTQGERWKLILSAAFRQFLDGKVIGSTGRLADAPFSPG